MSMNLEDEWACITLPKEGDAGRLAGYAGSYTARRAAARIAACQCVARDSRPRLQPEFCQAAENG